MTVPKQAILFEPSLCDGCQACAVACSFRKYGAFSREGAALEIAFDPLAGKATTTFRPSCDLCGSLVTPMCIEFCAPRALTLGRR